MEENWLLRPETILTTEASIEEKLPENNNEKKNKQAKSHTRIFGHS